MIATAGRTVRLAVAGRAARICHDQATTTRGSDPGRRTSTS